LFRSGALEGSVGTREDSFGTLEGSVHRRANVSFGALEGSVGIPDEFVGTLEGSVGIPDDSTGALEVSVGTRKGSVLWWKSRVLRI